MSKKRRRGLDGSLDFESGGLQSLTDVERGIYGGGLESLDDQRMTVEAINIMNIRPDPVQPRRAVPSAVRASWDGSPESVARMIAAWVDHAVEQTLDWRIHGYTTYLRDPEVVGDVEDDDPSPTVSSLIRLLDLAVSIRRDGLTNPITVSGMKGKYMIETGERRWLAFHLLRYHLDDGSAFGSIPARLVKRDVWRQASENTIREDLNAVGKARQFALLLMELYQERGTEFDSYDDIMTNGGNDRDFYAQVASGEDFPIPYGTGSKIKNAMGVANTTILRFFRQALNLDLVSWNQADDEDWTLGAIRNHFRSEPERTRSVSTDTVSGGSSSKPTGTNVPVGGSVSGDTDVGGAGVGASGYPTHGDFDLGDVPKMTMSELEAYIADPDFFTLYDNAVEFERTVRAEHQRRVTEQPPVNTGNEDSRQPEKVLLTVAVVRSWTTDALEAFLRYDNHIDYDNADEAWAMVEEELGNRADVQATTAGDAQGEVQRFLRDAQQRLREAVGYDIAKLAGLDEAEQFELQKMFGQVYDLCGSFMEKYRPYLYDEE